MQFQFRVYSRKSAIAQTTYALRIGIEILEYFEDYFNITYPLPKQGEFVRYCITG